MKTKQKPQAKARAKLLPVARKRQVSKKAAAKPAPVLGQKRGVSKKPAFLAAFLKTASVKKAARLAGIDRSIHYTWLGEDADYRVAFDAAREAAAQVLEDEAVRRAHEGTLKPVFFQGERVDVVVEYSDALLMFLLKGWRPERYRDRLEHSGPDGGPIEVELVDRLNAARNRLAMVRAQENAA
jgi:hypothetical protein